MIETNFKHTEIGLIPHDWEVKSLGEICDVRDGTHDSPKYVKSGYPLVTSKNLTNGVIDFANIQYISKVDYDKINERSKADIGDVLYAMIGTIGNPVLITKEPDFAIKNVALFKDIKKVCQAYIRYFFDSTYTIKRIMEDVSGSNQKFIPLGYFRNMPIPLPPTLAEQERIAGALSSIDTLIGTLNEQIEKKRHIKQGTMQQLLTGKKRLAGFTGEWKNEILLGEVIDIYKGQQVNNSELTDNTTMFPMLNGGSTPSGYYDKYNTPAYSITISEGGNSCGYVNYMKESFWAGGHCYIVKPIVDTCKDFLYYVLKYREPDIMKLRVGSGLPNIQRKTLLKEIVLLFPPTIAEQSAIAAVLSGMDTEIAALEQKRDKYIAIKSGMMQDLLTGKIRLV